MNRFLTSFFLILLSFPLVADEHTADSQGTAKTGKRLAAEGKLSPDAVTFLSKHFYKSEDIIKLDYEKEIPAAIEKAIQNKDEGDIAKITADLIATTNPTQAQKVLTDAKKEIEDETKGKDPGKYDTRYVALMERLLWAAMNRNGEFPEEDKAKEFNEAFKKPYSDARDFNKLANEKLKSAANGNAADREWVDKNVRKSTLLSLAEGQRSTGNKALSDNMIKGVSFKVGDQKVLDMWGPGKEPQRLYLGNTDESATQAIDKFLEAKGSFGGNAVARKELPNDEKLKSWYVNKDGGFTNGFPEGFAPKKPEPPKETQGGGEGGGGGGGSTQDFASYKNQVDAVLQSSCRTCHSSTLRGTSLANLELVGGAGKAVRLADFPALFNNTADPMYMQMSDAQKRQFEQFAAIQRAAK